MGVPSRLDSHWKLVWHEHGFDDAVDYCSTLFYMSPSRFIIMITRTSSVDASWRVGVRSLFGKSSRSQRRWMMNSALKTRGRERYTKVFKLHCTRRYQHLTPMYRKFPMYASALHRPSLAAQSRAARTSSVPFCYKYERTRPGDGCFPKLLRHSCIL